MNELEINKIKQNLKESIIELLPQKPDFFPQSDYILDCLKQIEDKFQIILEEDNIIGWKTVNKIFKLKDEEIIEPDKEKIKNLSNFIAYCIIYSHVFNTNFWVYLNHKTQKGINIFELELDKFFDIVAFLNLCPIPDKMKYFSAVYYSNIRVPMISFKLAPKEMENYFDLKTWLSYYHKYYQLISLTEFAITVIKRNDKIERFLICNDAEIKI